MNVGGSTSEAGSPFKTPGTLSRGVALQRPGLGLHPRQVTGTRLPSSHTGHCLLCRHS